MCAAKTNTNTAKLQFQFSHQFQDTSVANQPRQSNALKQLKVIRLRRKDRDKIENGIHFFLDKNVNLWQLLDR